jgi:hypothetical protein
MTRLQGAAAVAVMGVAMISVTALVAYRLGLRRGSPGAGSVSFSGTHSVDTSGACIGLSQAALHSGEQACVSGRVLKVYTSRSGTTFLDFCADYRNCPFTSVIFGSDRQKFGNLETLTGREVQIRGRIAPYHGQPEIVISDPGQIREAQ